MFQGSKAEGTTFEVHRGSRFKSSRFPLSGACFGFQAPVPSLRSKSQGWHPVERCQYLSIDWTLSKQMENSWQIRQRSSKYGRYQVGLLNTTLGAHVRDDSCYLGRVKKM